MLCKNPSPPNFTNNVITSSANPLNISINWNMSVFTTDLNPPKKTYNVEKHILIRTAVQKGIPKIARNRILSMSRYEAGETSKKIKMLPISPAVFP